jgi:TolB-like protein/Flp pilus assembly protein TadD/tRNA A-37 threonylcarbamoyl transferase component Bud32
MSSERWEQVERIYYSTLELAPERREAYLAEACKGDRELRREVESLLAQSNSSEGALDRPALDFAADLLSHPARTQLVPGKQFGAYSIEELLGEGGMGVVYRATDTRLKRPVAIKFLSEEFATRAAQRRFHREAQMVSSLNHPHILTVLDVGESGDRQYLVTEFIDGGTLKDWALREKPGWQRVVDLLTGVADGLAAAHAAGILHRDIKPANIFVAKNGYAKLGDFGLAKLEESISADGDATDALIAARTESGMVIGTLAYMSPEQASGKSLDARSDICSFGIVLYELLAGRRPFDGASGLETLQKIIHQVAEPLPETIPAALRRLVEKTIEKDPADRYQSMREMVIDLRRLARHSGVSAQAIPAAPLPLRSWPWAGSRRHLWSSLSAVVLLTALAALALTGRGRTFGRHSLSSIAVLPFENLSNDPEQESFSDGMTETLITELAGIQALKVISRASVMPYKKTHKPLKQIGNELGVDAVVEGSALRAGSRIRITAQLIETSSDHHLWASDYDRDFKDVLSLHKEVAQAIARQVGATLTPGEQKRLGSAHSVNPEGMAAYLRGLYEINQGDVTTSAAEAREAIRIDPKLAQAWELLGMTLLEDADFGRVSYSSIMQEARTSLRRALEIEPDRGMAVSTMGWELLVADHDWEQAEKWLRRGYELDPSTGTNYGTLLAARGRNEEAIEVTRKAIDRDPANPNVLANGCINYRLVRRYKDAISLCKKALEIDPAGAGFASRHLVFAYMLDEQPDAAFEQFMLGRARSSDPLTKIHDQLQSEYRRSGWGGVFRLSLRQFPPNDRSSLAMRIRLWAHTFLLDSQQALDELEALEKAGENQVIFLEDPRFDPIRAEPRYKAMLKRMGYPEAMWR